MLFAGIMLLLIVCFIATKKCKQSPSCPMPSCPTLFGGAPKFRHIGRRSGSDRAEEVARFNRMAMGSSMAYPSPSSSSNPMRALATDSDSSFEMTNMSVNSSRSFA
jgi:hypothetical protein